MIEINVDEPAGWLAEHEADVLWFAFEPMRGCFDGEAQLLPPFEAWIFGTEWNWDDKPPALQIGKRSIKCRHSDTSLPERC